MWLKNFVNANSWFVICYIIKIVVKKWMNGGVVYRDRTGRAGSKTASDCSKKKKNNILKSRYVQVTS